MCDGKEPSASKPVRVRAINKRLLVRPRSLFGQDVNDVGTTLTELAQRLEDDLSAPDRIAVCEEFLAASHRLDRLLNDELHRIKADNRAGVPTDELEEILLEAERLHYFSRSEAAERMAFLTSRFELDNTKIMKFLHVTRYTVSAWRHPSRTTERDMTSTHWTCLVTFLGRPEHLSYGQVEREFRTWRGGEPSDYSISTFGGPYLPGAILAILEHDSSDH